MTVSARDVREVFDSVSRRYTRYVACVTRGSSRTQQIADATVQALFLGKSLIQSALAVAVTTAGVKAIHEIITIKTEHVLRRILIQCTSLVWIIILFLLRKKAGNSSRWTSYMKDA